MTCGIGDYSRSLANALMGKAEVLFSNEVNEKVIEFAPDVVNFQWEYALYDSRRIASDLNILRKKNIRTSITMHGFSDYDSKNRILETMFDEYIVLNDGFRQHLIKRGFTKPIHVIPMGMHSYEFGRDDRTLVRDILGIGEREFVIGGFGFLELYKNFHTIIEALAEARMGMLMLCSFSKEPNSQYAIELQQTASRLGVRYRHLSGYMDMNSVAKVLHACDAIVYPYVDVFTYSSSAAIRTGISSLAPVIANDITFFDDIPDVAHGGPAYKVKNGLAEAVEKVFTDESIKRMLVDNAKEFIKQNSWDNIAERYVTSA